MSRRRRAAAMAGSGWDDDGTNAVDLFPFLSIFLCIMGVLAFLQILMATMDQRKIDLVGEQSQGWEVAYKIFCLPDGVIIVPPVKGLEALREKAEPGEDRDGQATLSDILQRRRGVRVLLQSAEGGVAPTVPVPEQAALDELLAEVLSLNQLARARGHLYEEVLLFGIYPGGGAAYHAFRERLDTPRFAGLRVGLEALDTNWKLSVGGP